MRASLKGLTSATIASAGTLSGAVNLGEPCEYLVVQCPATLTSCQLNLHASVDGTTYYQFGISETTDVTSGSAAFAFKLGGMQYVKINSSAAQGDDRVFTVLGVTH